jgi:hypothetical protein
MYQEILMPKKCSKCNYYSASTDETECPKCQAPLQFTLLGPPNQEAAPLEGLPSPVQQTRGANTGGGFDVITWSMQNWVILVFAVPVVIGALALLAGGLGGGGQSKFDQLQTGMTVKQVEAILGRSGSRTALTTNNTTVVTINNEMELTFIDGVLRSKRWLGPNK